MDAGYLVVLITAGSPEAGQALGRALVQEGLAGCVQVIPGGTAIYRWRGELYAEPQTQLIVKTRRDVWPRLQARVKELHTDEVPEVLALPVADGLPAYLHWLDEVTAQE